MKPPLKNLQFFPVLFKAFTNTNCNEVYIEHNFNAPNKEQTQRVPAMLYVKLDEHKRLLKTLSPGTAIRIKCDYDPETVRDTIVDIKVDITVDK